VGVILNHLQEIFFGISRHHAVIPLLKIKSWLVLLALFAVIIFFIAVCKKPAKAFIEPGFNFCFNQNKLLYEHFHVVVLIRRFLNITKSLSAYGKIMHTYKRKNVVFVGVFYSIVKKFCEKLNLFGSQDLSAPGYKVLFNLHGIIFVEFFKHAWAAHF
jgi:hypothetical protein